MKLVTSKEMAKIDRQATSEIGIPAIVLMENAGLRAASAIERHVGPLTGKTVCIVCGKGNNGGDGFVLARHLTNRNIDVRVVLLANKRDIKGMSKINLEVVLCMDIPLTEITTENEYTKLKNIVNSSDFIVDAIFGIGLRAAPRSFYQGAITLLNNSRKTIISMDIPTGLCPNTGNILGNNCIHADLTVTFALPKVGLVCSQHRQYVGQLEVVDISIPNVLTDNPEIKINLLERKDLKSQFKPRIAPTHKGNFGHVLVIAGSPGKTGAGIMAAQAALRSGAGLVSLGVPKSLHSIAEMKTTEVMTIGLPETDKHTVSRETTKQILPVASQMKAVAIGPGLNTHPETANVVEDLISNLNCPIVLDADGINNVPLASLQYSKAPLIITPHPGEMARLLALPTKEVLSNRLETVQKTAIACQTYVVLKGDRTLISDPEGNVFVNPTGNPGMASAGSGDVLTGIITGFLAQGFSPITACQAGVFIHGLAGDLAVEEKGEWGLIATDIIEYIPAAILNIMGGQD